MKEGEKGGKNGSHADSRNISNANFPPRIPATADITKTAGQDTSGPSIIWGKTPKSSRSNREARCSCTGSSCITRGISAGGSTCWGSCPGSRVCRTCRNGYNGWEGRGHGETFCHEIAGFFIPMEAREKIYRHVLNQGQKVLVNGKLRLG